MLLKLTYDFINSSANCFPILRRMSNVRPTPFFASYIFRTLPEGITAELFQKLNT